MGRQSKIWLRRGRGWHTTVEGRQIFLGHDRKQAQRAFHLLNLGERSPTQVYSVEHLVD